MPRQLRVQFPGAIYHVTIRGNGRDDIFVNDHDRERFLRRLAESLETYGVRLYLFCLMSNHVHLVLETPRGNLSRFMQSVETGYTVYYNFRHNRTGHVLQGRYGAKLVEGNEYLLNLSRYVHLNPVFIDKIKNLSLKKGLKNYETIGGVVIRDMRGLPENTNLWLPANTWVDGNEEEPAEARIPQAR